jgi:hypothetical protein
MNKRQQKENGVAILLHTKGRGEQLDCGNHFQRRTKRK